MPYSYLSWLAKAYCEYMRMLLLMGCIYSSKLYCKLYRFVRENFVPYLDDYKHSGKVSFIDLCFHHMPTCIL